MNENSSFFYLKTFQLIGTEGTRLLREKRVQGRPHRRKERRGGSRTARGKRVPGVEINVRIVYKPSKKLLVKSIIIEFVYSMSPLIQEGCFCVNEFGV
jgi:hypothetical protein